jgi:two-component system response regulator MprA
LARIFIADDDPDIRRILTHALADEGHEVAVAKDGDSALQGVLDDRPDLLILDVLMPAMDGFDVLQAIRDAGLDTRILVVTARSSEHVRERGFDLGADAFLSKPFEPEEFLDIVRQLLGSTPEELALIRERERDRAHLLSQLEEAFGEI